MKLQEAIPLYLNGKRKLSAKSRGTYRFVLDLFSSEVNDKPVNELTHQDLRNFITHLEKEHKAEATINLAVSAIIGFFEWAAFERLWDGNVADIHYVAEQSKSQIIAAAPIYDREIVAHLVAWGANYARYTDIIDKRDAFLILAASSTGARLGKELCQLKRGQVDWESGRAIVIGKGNKEGKLRFSDIALQAGRFYLQARAEMDGKSGQPLASLPLFARHSGKQTKPLGYHGAYKALKRRIIFLFGEDKKSTFHPHLLRHEFVTRILMETGNIKLAQDLARHKTIQTTQRYAHLAEEDQDRAYKEIFNKAVL
jgi:site-specific recombinase XerD